MLVFPGDFGGDAKDGPSSLQALANARVLVSADVRHFAFLMCDFAGSSQRRPLAVLSNTTVFEPNCYPGWPELEPQSGMPLQGQASTVDGLADNQVFTYRPQW